MMTQISVVIVDDEPLARRRLARLLAREPDVLVARQCSDGTEAVAAIKELRPDVAFVDVRMPGMDGFDALQSLGNDIPWVVFVTAYAEYAVRAFEVRALDYLLKPVDPDRLAEAMARIRDRLQDDSSGEQRQRIAGIIDTILRERLESHQLLARVPGRHPDRLLLRDGSDASFLDTETIHWIEAAGNYVRIHTAREVHLVRRTITELEQTLDPDQFMRIHRSTIVNLAAVDRLSPAFAGAYYVHLKGGKELVLSRGYRAKLFDRIGEDL
jgi:two-component system LytT family response regulator